MPTPRLLTIADIGYVFGCIHDREPRGGCGYYDANGHYTPVTNLGWLLRHSHEIVDLWVSTGTFKSLAIGGGAPFGRVNYPDFDAILAARLTNGRVYTSTWQSTDLLHRWLKRPKLLGRVVHWEHTAYVIGDHDYEQLARERARRRRCPNCGGPEGYSSSQGGHAVGCIHHPNGPSPIVLRGDRR